MEMNQEVLSLFMNLRGTFVCLFFVWHFFFFQLLFFVNCLDLWAVYYSTWYVFLINTFFWHNFIRLEAKIIKQMKHNGFSDCFLGFQRFSKSLTIIQRIYCQVC